MALELGLGLGRALMGFAEMAGLILALRALNRELDKMRSYRTCWALNDPVSYVWLCRAERRGPLVPWT
jgi:hypothetical protein